MIVDKLTPAISGLPANPGQASSPTLSVSLHHDWGVMENLRSSWNSILDENQRLTIFSTPEWLESWWKAYGSDKELMLLTFNDCSGAVVGIVPLYRAVLRKFLNKGIEK